MVAYSFKERFIQPIEVGLSKISLSFDCAPKRQTIRADGLRRHAMPTEQLQLYYAQRTKQCRLIGRARCNSVRRVKIKICSDGDLRISLDRQMLSDTKAEAFALDDGFGSIEDMWLFWRQEHPGVTDFAGPVIGWEPL